VRSGRRAHDPSFGSVAAGPPGRVIPPDASVARSGNDQSRRDGLRRATTACPSPRENFGEHVGRARIAPSGARIYVGAHSLTDLDRRQAHGTVVVGWVGEVWNCAETDSTNTA
jgi:hypothetical protein